MWKPSSPAPPPPSTGAEQQQQQQQQPQQAQRQEQSEPTPGRPRQESLRLPVAGRRIAQIVKLKPEFVARYKEVHAAVWPEVLQQIKTCNIRDCEFSILFLSSLFPIGSFCFLSLYLVSCSFTIYLCGLRSMG